MSISAVPLMLSSCVVRDYWFYCIDFVDGVYLSEEVKWISPYTKSPYISFKLTFYKLPYNEENYGKDNIVLYRRAENNSQVTYEDEFYYICFYTQKEGEDYIPINLHDLIFSHINRHRYNPKSVYFEGTDENKRLFKVYLDKNGIERISYDSCLADMKLVKEG